MSTPSRPVLAIVGEALVDLVEEGDDEPRLARPGGSPYNVAIGLARLDRHAAFVGRFSRDPLGSILRRHAERSGVDLARAVDAPEPTTIAMVDLSEGIAQYRFGMDGTADFRFTDAELAHAADGVELLHFGSLTSWTSPGDAAVTRLVDRVRDRTLVTYDPNVRPHLQPDATAARARIETSLRAAHLVKTSDEDVSYLYPGTEVDEVARRWLALGPALVIVTRGGAGATAYRGAGQISRPVVQATLVDTVGAGDAFMSGLLDRLVEAQLLSADRLAAATDPELVELLDHAALVAAITCSRAGANPPRRAELESFASRPARPSR